MNTIKVSGTGDTDARVASLEQAINYGEVILPFVVVDEQEGGGTGGGGPPTGPAGGDLTGTYPNPELKALAVGTPELADGAVTDPKITSVSYGKVTGAPTSLPPSGAAGGDLTGTYPNPTVAAGKITRAKTAPDCWLSPIPVDPTDVTKVLTVAAGPTLVWQTPAVTEGITGRWNYRTADGTGDPGVRNLSPDVAAAPTFLRFSKTEVDGTDATNVLVTTDVGDVLIAQQRTDASHWSKAQVRAPIVDHGTWVEVPITVLANSGLGPPADNADVDVQFQRGAGSTTYPPGGPAGGDLSGTYPNPQIAAGAIVDADVSATAAIQYSKLTGVPTSLPPSGAALGDLTGTYPGPTVAAGKITAAKLSPAPVAGDVGKMVTVAAGPALAYTAVPTSLPPSGAAGGDLTGTYPNPTIGAGAVGNAEISDVAYAKVTGAPTSLPPSGPASGDLTGTYPAPTIAKLNGAAVGTTTPLARGDLLVADATPALKRLGLGAASTVLQSNGTDVVWGTSLGGPPSGPAGGDLAGTYPNPTVIPAARSKWTDTGTVLTPTPAAYANKLTLDSVGKLSLFSTSSTFVEFGPAARTAKARLMSNTGGLATAYLTCNQPLNAAENAWIQDDVTKPSWRLGLMVDAGDNFHLARTSPGGVGANLLVVDSAGKLTLPGDATDAVCVLGAQTTKARLIANNTAAWSAFSYNTNTSTGSQDDATKPSWEVLLRADVDQLTVRRRAPGGTLTTPLTLDNAGKLTVPALDVAGMVRWTGSTSRFGITGTYDFEDIGYNMDASYPAYDFTWAGWLIRMGYGGGDQVQILRRTPSTTGLTALLAINNAGNFTISGAQAVKASGATWANPSDRRLKDAIEDYTTGLAAILQLQPRTFVYNGKAGSTAGMRGYGFVADEVESVMPETVGVRAGKLNPEDETETDIQTLDQSNLVLALVNAVKELAARVAALEAPR